MTFWMILELCELSLMSSHPSEKQRRNSCGYSRTLPGGTLGKMQGIRNVLVHEYFRLDEEILWKAALEISPAH
jgi:hypothetical protein